MIRSDEKPRVLIDLDGVVRDWVGSLVRVYKQKYPDHEVLPVTSRALEEFFPIGEEIYRFVDGQHIEDIMVNAEPYPGAVEALQRWEAVFEIVVVTAQPPNWRYANFIWIGKHRIPTNEVHICFQKSRIDGVALLDDFVDNLEDFAATGRLAVCMDRPWNQEWKGERVKTVEEFFRLVQYRLNISSKKVPLEK